jgi:hypothetical protein
MKVMLGQWGFHSVKGFHRFFSIEWDKMRFHKIPRRQRIVVLLFGVMLGALGFVLPASVPI